MNRICANALLVVLLAAALAGTAGAQGWHSGAV